MTESPLTEAMMVESPPTEAMVESPFSESPITRAKVESPMSRDYVAGNDKYVVVFDPADMVNDSDWSCSGCLKDAGYDDDGYDSPVVEDCDRDPFVGDPEPFVMEPSLASDVYQFYHYVDGNPDNLEEPDLASGNLDAFMPLFAQIALDTYHPLRNKNGPVKLYFVKMGNVCSKPDRKDHPQSCSYHFNFWATFLGPGDNVDPTQLSPDHDMVGNFYAEAHFWNGDIKSIIAAKSVLRATLNLQFYTLTLRCDPPLFTPY
ncbi:hypothetical protein Tsubulata_015381 [Turnera subulata]|uniref:Uncharacterized protein n=1 Tax=Turnera subulata TaxID=218843 RepID=A0A9Q0GC84_9ROSI|nr:hypothetical protein Tsubulata_015381 [Turnera subulata]